VTKLWGGRFSEEPAAELMAFTESLSFDRVLAREDCQVLGAHAKALTRAGLLSDQDLSELLAALAVIADEIGSGTFVFEAGDEDIHTAVERALLVALPEIGPRVRAGLSRNDRVATAVRMWLQRQGRAVVGSLCDMIDAICLIAAEHARTLMPGYTHLQRAQPITLGHHLLAHGFAFERDAQRFVAALGRANESPLGSGALAGSTLGLAHDPVDVGLSGAMMNSIDAVASRDSIAEFLAAAAICGTHCSRLGEEIVLWTSSEFAFAQLGDAFATGSSLMPQKKNPDIAELARGKSGRLVGNLTALLVTLKGLPLAYNRDLQEDKEPLFDSVRTLMLMLPALTGALASLRFDEARMADAASDSALLATDIAERLVQGGASFREAHERVGAAIAADTLADLAAATNEGADVAGSVARRGAPGPSPASIEAQLAHLRTAIAELRAR